MTEPVTRSWIENGNLYQTASCIVPVSPRVAWQVMTDHEAYGDAADNLMKVEVLSGQGVGMRRRCYNTNGGGWSETCTLWDEGREYAFRVHTEAPDYPYPLKQLSGTWRVDPVPQGSRVSLEFLARAKGGILGRMMLRLLARPAEQSCRRLLKRWAAMMVEAGTPTIS